MNDAMLSATRAMQPQALGFGHFVAQSDAVGLSLLVILTLMSIVSWVVILAHAWRAWQAKVLGARFLQNFWRSATLDEVESAQRDVKAREPFGRLTEQALAARSHHSLHASDRRTDAGSLPDFLTRALRQTLDDEAARMEGGLALLATIGATAPFVGLLGTVWGIYHALVAIGLSGAGTLDKVAGPVGEALIMTGLGLAVAIPAVVGYNWRIRRNRVLASRLDSFAFQLHTLLATGASLPRDPRGA